MIELQNISKSFDGVSVLDNISAKIPDSGIFAICGASGSGKTTLGKVVAEKLGYPYFDVDDYIWRQDTVDSYTQMCIQGKKR